MLKVKRIDFMHLGYVLVVRQNSVEIMTKEKLESVQKLEFPGLNVIDVFGMPSRNAILVLCNRFIFIYGFLFTRIGTIK